MKNRNLQIINCDYGCDVIITPPARNENRKLLIYLKNRNNRNNRKNRKNRKLCCPLLDNPQ